MKGILNDKLLNLFIDILKEIIQHEACLVETKSLDNSFGVENIFDNKNIATIRVVSNTYKYCNVLTFILTKYI